MLLKHKQFLFILFVILCFYSPWFFHNEIIGGDWPFFFPENIKEFTWVVPAWSPMQGTGLGGQILTYSIDSYLYFVVSLFVHTLHIPWLITYKICFFGLFIASAVSSILFLVKSLFGETGFLQKLLSSLIFTTNTYILMIATGGQMGVSLAYGFSPLVIGMFIHLLHDIFEEKSFIKQKTSIMTGFVLALQMLFDSRIAFLTIGIVFFYFISMSYYTWQKTSLRNIFYVCLPFLIVFCLHFYWIFPLLYFKSNPLPQGFDSQASFTFLSFGSFSQSLSLLHPNWPENIFGKVSFMKSEFLLLPVLFFSALFYVVNIPKRSKVNQKNILSLLMLVLLGIIGIFLGKGANDPYGFINIYLFKTVPGFNFFRDPTKWYLLTAVVFSVVIPYTIHSFTRTLENKKVKIWISPSLIIPLFFIGYWLYLLSPLFEGKITKTFSVQQVPNEYVSLSDYLNNQQGFSRTLWVPMRQRFSFSSNNHPAVEASNLFKTSNINDIAKSLHDPKSRDFLQSLSIKYVIVPYDSTNEIFLKDRKYSKIAHDQAVESLNSIQWIRKLNGFGKNKVFQIPGQKNHFWLQNNGSILDSIFMYDTYSLHVSTSKRTQLVFSENYSPFWKAKIQNKIIPSVKSKYNLNEFVIPAGKSTVIIYNLQTEYYTFARVVSLVSFLVFLLYLVILYYRKL